MTKKSKPVNHLNSPDLDLQPLFSNKQLLPFQPNIRTTLIITGPSFPLLILRVGSIFESLEAAALAEVLRCLVDERVESPFPAAM